MTGYISDDPELRARVVEHLDRAAKLMLERDILDFERVLTPQELLFDGTDQILKQAEWHIKRAATLATKGDTTWILEYLFEVKAEMLKSFVIHMYKQLEESELEHDTSAS